jgi:hypothetical protein
MAGPTHGWHDSPGGVEPGFAEAAAMRFGAGRGDTDDMELTPYGAPGTSGQARDEEWLQHLLEYRALAE